MTNIDQFESLFRAADKMIYVHEAVDLGQVTVVTDLGPADAERFTDAIGVFLAAAGGPRFRVITGERFGTAEELLAELREHPTDLICTHRHLHAERTPYTIGELVEVLTQVAASPVLVVPHPLTTLSWSETHRDTDSVMAITDHLSGDQRLVRYAAAVTKVGGTLHLTHVEDQQTFNRYIDVISRIPDIDTDMARSMIYEQLLQEPRDYISSCRSVLESAGVNLTVEAIVTIGQNLSTYRSLIESNAVDLLVLNTRDHDQLAMHGLAYPLAVELRETPLLML